MLVRLGQVKLHDSCGLAAPEISINRKSPFTLLGKKAAKDTDLHTAIVWMLLKSSKNQNKFHEIFRLFYNLPGQQAVGRGGERYKIFDSSKLFPNMNFLLCHSLFLMVGTYSQMRM